MLQVEINEQISKIKFECPKCNNLEIQTYADEKDLNSIECFECGFKTSDIDICIEY